jgi:hypothetical protein
MARSTRKERRIRGLTTTLEHLPVDAATKIEQVRFAWARRRVIEGRYIHAGRGEVSEPMSVFDLWLGGKPESSDQEPDRTCSSAHEAAERLLKEGDWNF